MTPPEKPAPTVGLAHFFAAVRYSAAGLKRLSQEPAFRQQVMAGLVILGAMGVLGASAGEMLGFLGLMFILAAVEALNTAIEVIVDHLSPGWSQFAKEAKDLGSLAVALVMAAMGAYLLWVALT